MAGPTKIVKAEYPDEEAMAGEGVIEIARVYMTPGQGTKAVINIAMKEWWIEAAKRDEEMFRILMDIPKRLQAALDRMLKQ